MKARWLGLAVTAAALVAGCGQGRAIFNVDVFSFLQGTGKDTVHYTAPPSFSATFQNAPIAVNLVPGAGSSIVDTVRFTGNANVENRTGSGSMTFKVYLATDSNAVYTDPNGPAITVGPATVPGPGTTTPLPISTDLLAAFRNRFTQSKLFVGVQASVTSNAGAIFDGRVRLTALTARIVLQDKIF